MTTIVAVETPSAVIIGCDSQATMGGQRSVMDMSKVIVKGPYVFGVAGRLRMAQALRHASLPPIELEDTDEHVSEVLAPALKELANRAELEPHDSIVLAVIRRRVYLLTGDGTYMRNTTGHYAIGSGSDYALGALAGLESVNVSDVERALKAAANYDIGTAAPFKISVIR